MSDSKRLLLASLIAAATAAAIPAPAAAAAASRGDASRSGAVYVLANQAAGNAVLVYTRAADGTLTPAGSVPTGGLGGGGLGGDPLASQGAVTLAGNYLFAVNAGSNDVSLFSVKGDRLVLVDRQPSGGEFPVSIAVHDARVYVLNAGGTPNISGFRLDESHGRLTPLAGSQRPLAGGTAARPAEVAFSPDGGALLVSEKGTQTIDSYTVDEHGYASNPTAHASSGVTPFGFSVTRRGYAVFSEAGSGAASSYDIGADGGLQLVTGSVALGQAAPCWLVTTADGRTAYTANAGSGSISRLSVARDGSLSLVDPVAGVLAAPLDLALTADSRFLYVREGNGAIGGFKVGTDGSLVSLGAWAGVPAGAQGIAAR